MKQPFIQGSLRVAEAGLLVVVNTIDCFPFAPVPVIKKTWEKDAFFLEYYSDHADSSIPTINLGVPNTERGKCSFYILNLFSLLLLQLRVLSNGAGSAAYTELHEK